MKTEGDAFFVTFFTPLDAVRWCLAVQQALLENEWPAELLKQPSGRQENKDGAMVFNGLRIRMGIHVGHPACRRNPITGRMGQNMHPQIDARTLAQVWLHSIATDLSPVPVVRVVQITSAPL